MFRQRYRTPPALATCQAFVRSVTIRFGMFKNAMRLLIVRGLAVALPAVATSTVSLSWRSRW